jgi:hypothetical protein
VTCAVRYGARDSLGNRMDTAKVITSPVSGYLAVYHSGRVCRLVSSDDLMTWMHRAVIDEPATQPTIAMAPDGGLVTAAEFDDGRAAGSGSGTGRRWVRCCRAVPRGSLWPRTLSECDEGTPSIRRIVFAPDLDASMIELGFHYHWRCRVDRQLAAR